MRQKHAAKDDCKFNCNFCAFQTDILMEIFEHKFEVHPEIDTDFKPKSMNAKDFVLNLAAEQNMELIEEVLAIKQLMMDKGNW